jgi:cell wall assembly regulator SMI1
MNLLTKDKADRILTELRKFSDAICELGNPINDNRLETFETNFGMKLPDDFKYMIRQHNSFSLSGVEVHGFEIQQDVQSIEQVIKFEHLEAGNPMFPDFLPFSPDGYGNYYCLDLSRIQDDVCPIIFWQHDYFYEKQNEVETCHDSFLDWVQEVMIDWTLEEMNYDGSSK